MLLTMCSFIGTVLMSLKLIIKSESDGIQCLLIMTWPGTPIQILHFNLSLFSDSVAFRKSLPASSFSEDDSFETSSYGKAESIGSAGSLAIRSNSSSGGHSSASGQSTEEGTTIESKTLCIQTSINRAKNKSAECTNGTSEDASCYFWHLRNNICLKLGAFKRSKTAIFARSSSH